MRDQMSNLLMVAIVGVAIIGLGTYLVTLQKPLPDSAYTTTIEADGAYILPVEKNWTDYDYAERERFASIVEKQIADLSARLSEMEAGNMVAAETKAEVNAAIVELRHNLKKIREAKEAEWEPLREQMTASYEEASEKLEQFSH